MALDHFSVTRGTTKTVLNKNGVLETVPANVPAFEFNPDGTFKGCLIEPSATNLVQRSEEFDNAYWVETGINRSGTPAFVNQTIAPDGTMTADKLIEDTSTGQHNLRSAFLTVPLSYVTLSGFVKKAEKSVIGLRFLSTTLNGEAIFDLNNGTIISTSGDGTPIASIIALPNDWFRITLSAIPSGTAASFRFALYGANNELSYTGDGTSGVFIWGAQLEAGSVATSYIPATDSTATRNADVISKTGASGLIGQTEGSVYVEINLENITTDASRNIVSIRDSSASRELFVNSLGRIAFRNVTSGTTILGKLKICFTYTGALENISLYINGQLRASGVAGATGINESIGIGFRVGNNDRFLNDHIRSFALYKRALTEAEAIKLTTL